MLALLLLLLGQGSHTGSVAPPVYYLVGDVEAVDLSFAVDVIE